MPKCLFIVGMWLAATPAVAAERCEQLIDTFRAEVILADGFATLGAEEQARVSAVGRHLSYENHRRTAALLEELNEVAAARTCLSQLASPTRRLADLLAVRTLFESWQPPLAVQAEHAALKMRVDAALAQYEAEAAAALAVFGKRGEAPRRESWNDYVSYLKTQLSRAQLMTQYVSVWQAMTELSRSQEPVRTYPVDLTGSELPENTVVLTFDDGPFYPTRSILDTLKKNAVHAVFFQVGSNVSAADGGVSTAVDKTTRGAQLTSRVLAEGHLLGNHSFTHALLTQLLPDQLERELDRTDAVLGTFDGGHPILFRPPYGARNSAVAAQLTLRHKRAYLWNVDSLDWADPVPSSIVQNVMAQLARTKRGVVLMHDIHAHTAQALPMLLTELRARGYRIALWDGVTLLDTGASTATRVAPLYRTSHAVVIGVDAYDKWPKLSYAVNDARAVRDVLVRQLGFLEENVVFLSNAEATRERILTVLGDELTKSTKVEPDDRLFVFFAGHGATRTLHNGKTIGYWVPVDADLERFESTAISMTQLNEVSEAIPARHIFWVVDACYGGLGLTRGTSAQVDSAQYLHEMTRRVARNMLTAGGADQAVSDLGPQGHSVFTWTLLKGLEGAADLNADHVISATELYGYIAPQVSAISSQTPAFGNLPGSEGGEFLLPLSRTSEVLSGDTAQLSDADLSLKHALEKTQHDSAAKDERLKALLDELDRAKHRLEGYERADAGVNFENAAAFAAKGLALYKEHDYPQALGALERSFELDSASAEVANNIGFVHFRLGNHAEALMWLNKALKLDPYRSVAFINQADVYEAAHENEKAVAALKKYLAQEPASPTVAQVKARVDRLTKKPAPAPPAKKKH